MAAALACNPSIITGILDGPTDIPVVTVEPNLTVSAPSPAVDITHLPTAQQMVDELRVSSVLNVQTPPPATVAPNTPEPSLSATLMPPDPTQSILLANTAPTYQRPTAAHLLSMTEPESHSSILTWLLPLSFVCLLGVAGFMMYIQMRSGGLSQLMQLLHS